MNKARMTPVLDDLLNDSRLERLFSKDIRHCALQLWILQIKASQLIENRVVYGRLLPYSHSNDRWSSSDDDNFRPFGQVHAQVIRVHLYVKSVHCADLLRHLCAGRTIAEVSEALKLGLSDQMKARFGATALATGALVYRPVTYLLNHDAHDRRSPSSPHGGGGALSASVTQSDKGALFRLGEDYDVDFTKSVIKHLNADTGLDFGGTDTARFGDLELLVFPTLDDLDRPLLEVDWAEAPRALVARFNPMQVPHFSGFLFRLSIANGGQLIYSGITRAERGTDGLFEGKFELSDQLHAMTDSTELEIFGFHGDHSGVGTLCSRWQIGYVREIQIQGHVAGGARPVKFDWLERTTRPSAESRVKAALTIDRGNLGLTNRIGGREADPWVPGNRDIQSLLARLHPPTSEGRFFQRWGQGDGEGRLQFVEWFKALLAKYRQHQVVIFDPYFDEAGLGLVLLCAAEAADYVVFRSLPKSATADKPMRRKSDKYFQEGINNLLANCEQSGHLMKRIRLRMYGLKEGRLHDRYILIMGPDRLPVAGFNLSNSLQKAAENYPLLVTPIPADVLVKVEEYKSSLLNEAEAAPPDDKTENPSMRLLFDSRASPIAPPRYEPLRFLDKAHAGDALSVWTGEPSLQGLTGGRLKERLAALGLLKNDSLVLPEKSSLPNWLAQQAGDFSDFAATWEVLGEVLAHSHFGDSRFSEIESQRGFLEFLARFLDVSFKRTHNEMSNELAVVDAKFFQKSVEALLHSSFLPDHLFHPTKYAALTWSEYYTIKVLWWYASDALLSIAEAQNRCLQIENQGTDVVRLSLLSQIVSEVSLSVQFGLSDVQRDRLVCSGDGLLQWMGLNAIERQLEKPGGFVAVQQMVSSSSFAEQVQALGWMVHRAARNPEKAGIFHSLVAALHDLLPAFSADELKCLVDSMRGHMRQLSWAEPWLFQDVVFPLLRDDRANTDDACEIWVRELTGMLEPDPKGKPELFHVAREGQTTKITAFLFAHSSPEQQQASLKAIQAILNRQRRIVQQPLASTSDWTRWDSALVVSMWILTFTRWGQYYLRERDMAHSELDALSRQAHELAMVRTMVEWRSYGTDKWGQFAAFLDQVEELLANVS